MIFIFCRMKKNSGFSNFLYIILFILNKIQLLLGPLTGEEGGGGGGGGSDARNGILARLIMDAILLRHGLPPCLVSTRFRRDYATAVSAAVCGGDLRRLLRFLAGQMVLGLTV
jgi:hypothetical protein